VKRTAHLLAFVALLAGGWDAAAAHGRQETAPRAPVHRGAPGVGAVQLARDDREHQKGHGNAQGPTHGVATARTAPSAGSG